MCTEVVWNGCNDSIGLMKGVMTLTEDKKGEEKSLDCLQKKKRCLGRKGVMRMKCKFWKHWGQDNCFSDVAVEGIVLPKRSAMGCFFQKWYRRM